MLQRLELLLLSLVYMLLYTVLGLQLVKLSLGLFYCLLTLLPRRLSFYSSYSFSLLIPLVCTTVLFVTRILTTILLELPDRVVSA